MRVCAARYNYVPARVYEDAVPLELLELCAATAEFWTDDGFWRVCRLEDTVHQSTSQIPETERYLVGLVLRIRALPPSVCCCEAYFCQTRNSPILVFWRQPEPHSGVHSIFLRYSGYSFYVGKTQINRKPRPQSFITSQVSWERLRPV